MLTTQKIIILIFLLFSQLCSANMAQPIPAFYKLQTVSGSPFLSRYVDISHEDLVIKINKDFTRADISVKYHIQAEKQGRQIPLLFVASDYSSNFEAFIDGKAIKFKRTMPGVELLEKTPLVDFLAVFGDKLRDFRNASVNNLGFYVSPDDLIFFEADIDKGKHLIEVSYTAKYWQIAHNNINHRTFRYALSPAKYWKSYGTLDLTIDARSIDHDILKNNLAINLPLPDSGNFNTLSHWQFNKMPSDIIEISQTPSLNLVAKLLHTMGSTGLAYFLGISLIIMHLLLLYSYRSHYPDKRFSPVLIIGNLVIPLLILSSGLIYNYLFSYALGELAAPLHGAYYYMLLFSYPLVFLVYGTLALLVDFYFKNKHS